MNELHPSEKRSILAIPLLGCLLLLAFPLSAKVKSDAILVNRVSVSKQLAQPGDRIDFTADFSSRLKDTAYRLHVCKTRSFAPGSQECLDGAWCETPSPSPDQPLVCSYTVDGGSGAHDPFYLFVCNGQNVCSSPYAGYFSVLRDRLSLEVPARLDFKPLALSFDPQESAGNPLGEITVTSLSAHDSAPSWSVDVSAEIWRDSAGDTLDIDGDGIRSGQLTVDLDSGHLECSHPLTGIHLGKTASFSRSVRSINLLRSDRDNPGGTFTLEGVYLNQSIPALQPAGAYRTVLTFTID